MDELTLDWKSVEEKWQGRWGEAKLFETNPKSGGKKLFITVAFPYPNSPQHVGHGRTFTLTDAYARFKRMQGYNVLFPMAFHYTGTPVLAISKRIAAGEKELIDDFVNLYKVPQEVVNTFVDPINIAKYFHHEIREGMKEVGYSIDWRREFTTIDPPYSKFIEWQFNKLRSKGLITRGSHPVGWCQVCGSPMGQHDTVGDVDPEIGELFILKFRLGEAYLPAATLRPETVFGVTNIWVKPDAAYVKAVVDGETWIVSEECANKLRLLEREVLLAGKIEGRDLIGKCVENPVTGDHVLILPASFVDPNNATGVVMSVPAHAPYDYVALEELKRDGSQLSEFDLEPDLVRGIQPISLISLNGYSMFPAKDVTLRLEINEQTDAKIEEATKEIYTQEFRSGKMKENTGQYVGMKIPEARTEIEKELVGRGKASTMYELLNRPVFCRCGSEVVVKIFRDQWFINYGNEEWKSLAHKCLNVMDIFPEELRVEFTHTIDWLKEKACARKQGLGTRLPWDREWIIESLSDSVIYMSYYTIARHIKDTHIDPAKLDEEVFDYVFLAIGNPDAIGKDKDLDPNFLREMRSEFEYFYPLDSRNSGRDLVPNHLTFLVFNHVAIFPEDQWPKQIVVNGSVLMEGKKMSKSFGNIIPLRDAIRIYGADPFRIAVLVTAELHQDADFSTALSKTVGERLERFYSFALQVIGIESAQGDVETTIDRWILARLHQRIKTAVEAMGCMRFREAIHSTLYMLDHDVQWYLRRSASDGRRMGSPSVLKQILETRVLLLAPFAPHLCEEIWERMGKPPFVSTAAWPSYSEDKIDMKVFEGEELVKTLRDDVSNIIQVTKTTPRRIIFYTASAWKWVVYEKALALAMEGQINIKDLLNGLMANSEFKRNARRIAMFVQKIIPDVKKMAVDMVMKRRILLDETKIVTDAKNFFSTEFNVEVIVYNEDDPNCYDPKGRAQLAEPYRPAIYIE